MAARFPEPSQTPLRRTVSPGSPRPAGPSRRSPTRRGAAALVALAVLFTAGIVVGRASGPAVAEAAPGAEMPDFAPADFDVYWEALGAVKDRFVDRSKLSDENLTWGSIRGMVDALGDSGHTVFLTPDEVEAEQQALDGRIVGIGIEVDLRGGIPLIVSVFDGTPADRAGLLPGDLILAVDGQRTDRLTVDGVVRRIQGPRGSKVRLRVQHRDGRTEQVAVVRTDIVVPAVTWGFVPSTRIADIALVQFSEGAASAMRDAVRRVLDRGATGIILDLRGNPGGLVSEAIGVASVFMADGVVFQERDREGDTFPIRVDPGAVAPTVPLTVLVDFGSASSAEIVSGALQDSGRAQVVGQRTFGTGTVLDIVGLSDGSAIRLGVVEWLTPNGDRIYESGITPDFTVSLPVDGIALDPGDLEDLSARAFGRSGDTQLRRAVQVLRHSVSP
jgi:carboxyl-terminal processing protease